MEYLKELTRSLIQLKNLYDLPTIYIDEYFSQIAKEFDDEFNQKKIIASNYQKINNRIEILRNNCIDRVKDSYENDFKDKIDKEIKLFEMQIDQFVSNEETFKKIKESISKTENKINEYLFSNQTIVLMTNFGKEKKTFLLIIKDEYFSKETLSLLKNPANILSNEQLKMLDLNKILAKRKNLIELSLDYNLIQKLDLSYEKISSIELNAFKGLINLTELDLDCNQINIINSQVFHALSNLKRLNLFSSQILMIEDNAFFGLENLEILNLDNNSLTEINLNTFNGLSKLIKLDLSKNKINYIEDNAFQFLSNLKELYLFSNEINQINQNTFYGLTDLIELNLIDNKLFRIEKNTFDCLTNLKQLKLTKNKIQKIDEYAFERASKLEGRVLNFFFLNFQIYNNLFLRNRPEKQ
jgi:Leucine-rich repeat (LRR) protein